ncbi:MAG: DUF1343 domain-containing protein [Simkaniaceae bacterium]
MKISLLLLIPLILFGKTKLGIDELFSPPHIEKIQGKKIGLITNQTGVDGNLVPTYERLLNHKECRLVALFSPEHGFNGSSYAAAKIQNGKEGGLPLYSLHGSTRRPTNEMLEGIDLLIYDIQDIGIRSYTYATTLFYVMEEAAKRDIPVLVLDRPNPLSGHLVDGPLLETKWRSFIGYIDVPYCHGLTIGELANYYNEEYRIQCKLRVVPMKNWKREMFFHETGLHWIPTSPHIPESTTALFCATTGILGELGIVSIGIGYTLPFKLVGAPWIDAKVFAEKLNNLNLPGVLFRPFHFKPFYGAFKGKECQGVLILINDQKMYRPLNVQYALLGLLKSLYPKEFSDAIKKLSDGKKELFCKALGSDVVLKILEKERFITYKLLDLDKRRAEEYKKKREKYFIYLD